MLFILQCTHYLSFILDQHSNQQGNIGFYREIVPHQTNNRSNDRFSSYSSINQFPTSSYNPAHLRTDYEYSIPTLAQFPNYYRGVYDNNQHTSTTTDFHNLPSQIECQRNSNHYPFMYNQHHQFHQEASIPAVQILMETVIKQTSESDESEPSLCEILSKADDSNYRIEELRSGNFDANVPHNNNSPTIVETVALSCSSYPAKCDEQQSLLVINGTATNNRTLPIDHPDPLVTFYYESPPEPTPPLCESFENLLQSSEPVVSHCSFPNHNFAKAKSAVAKKTKTKKLKIVADAAKDSAAAPKKTICESCNKTFNGHSYYLQHFRTHHSGEKRFRCVKCGKKFFDASSMESHSLKHVMKTHQCHQCIKMFAHKYDLTRHMITHQSKLPHECHLCSKGFVRHDHMKQHEVRCKKSPDFLTKRLMRKKAKKAKKNIESSEN